MAERLEFSNENENNLKTEKIADDIAFLVNCYFTSENKNDFLDLESSIWEQNKEQFLSSLFKILNSDNINRRHISTETLTKFEEAKQDLTDQLSSLDNIPWEQISASLNLRAPIENFSQNQNDIYNQNEEALSATGTQDLQTYQESFPVNEEDDIEQIPNEIRAVYNEIYNLIAVEYPDAKKHYEDNETFLWRYGDRIGKLKNELLKYGGEQAMLQVNNLFLYNARNMTKSFKAPENSFSPEYSVYAFQQNLAETYSRMLAVIFYKDDNPTMEVDNLFPMQEDFGRGIVNGHLKVNCDLDGTRSFAEMSGGTVEIESLTDKNNKTLIASDMDGGRLRIGHAEGSIAWRSSDGVISIDNFYGGSIADSSKDMSIYIKNLQISRRYDHETGKILPPEICKESSIRNTVFIENISGDFPAIDALKDEWNRSNNNFLFKVRSKKEVPDSYKDAYIFEESTGNFLHIGQRKKADRDPRFYSMDEIKKIKEDRLMYIHDTKNEPIDYSEIHGGIAVVKKADNLEIGKDMEGGIVIIDDPNLSYEQASDMVSKNNENIIVLYLRRWKEQKNRFSLPVKRAEFIEIK